MKKINTNTITISKSRITYKEGKAILSANIAINDQTRELWFAVPEKLGKYLTKDNADPFVSRCFFIAATTGYDIVIEDTISERLKFGLTNVLAPSFAETSDMYKTFQIFGPTTNETYPSIGAVGCAYSGGVDSFYTIKQQMHNEILPLTHVCVFNCGAWDGWPKKQRKDFFDTNCMEAHTFANQNNLREVFVDSNSQDVFTHEPRPNLTVLRNAAGALALKGLFKSYIFSTAVDEGAFVYNKTQLEPGQSDELFIRLLAISLSTESLKFNVSGGEVKRYEKLKELSEWPPSYDRLHPCLRTKLGTKNCGNCKKDIPDQSVLWALGENVLRKYSKVYDVDDFLKNIDKKIGFLLAYEACHPDYITIRETVDFLKKNNNDFPKEVYKQKNQYLQMHKLLESRNS